MAGYEVYSTGSKWAYHILSTGERYCDLGPDHFDRVRDPRRETDRLVRRLNALGHNVTLTPAA